MSMKKQIVEATLQLIRSEDNTDLSIQYLSDYSGIPITNIESNYETIEQIINMVFELGTSEHLAKSKVIIENSDPLINLLNHDLEFTFRVNFMSKKYNPDSTIIKLYRKDLSNVQFRISKFYRQLLESKTYLLPEDFQDTAVYSMFIVHSLFFLTKENLENILPTDTTKESATLQVIESLFPKVDLGFQIA